MFSFFFVFAFGAHYAEEEAEQQRKKAQLSNKSNNKGNNNGGGGTKGGKGAAKQTDECRTCGEAPTLEGRAVARFPPESPAELEVTHVRTLPRSNQGGVAPMRSLPFPSLWAPVSRAGS